MTGRRGNWEPDQVQLLNEVDALASKVLSDGPGASGGGLVERFRRQAVAHKQAEQDRWADLLRQARLLSDALRSAYRYLNELTEQLNVVRPTRPRSVPFHGSIVFEGLAWCDGRADFRLRPGHTDPPMLDRVTLGYRLVGPRALRVEREQPALDRLGEALTQWRIPHTLHEVRNERGLRERGAYVFTPELRCSLCLTADDSTGMIRMRMTNVDRFGSAEFELPPAALDAAALENLGALLVGESGLFLSSFRRIA